MNSSPTAPSVIPARAWRTLAVTSAVGFMVSLEITVISLALPDIRASFPGASESMLSWIITAYNIGVASLLLVAGWGADRFGRKRTFLIGLAVFAVGSLGSGLAPNATLLILARVVQSIGGAMQFPAGLALLLPAFPYERRQMAIGVWGAMGGLAAALGPPTGGLLVGAFGWPAVFLVNVPVAILALVLGAMWLEESVNPDIPSRVDLVSIPAASLGVGALILAIVQAEIWGVLDAATLIAVAIGLVLIAVFITRSRRHPAPLFDLELFTLRSYWLGCVGTVAFVVGFFSFFVPFPTYLQEVWGWSAIETGLAIVPGPLLAAFISPVVGRIADRVGNGPILAVGGLAGVISMVLVLAMVGLEPSLLSVIVPNLFLGFAAGCSFAMSVGATMRDVPPQRFGMGGAGRTTVFQLGVALAIAIAVAVIGEPASDAARLSASRLNWTVCLVAFAAQAAIFGLFFPRGIPAAPGA
ncbi:MAG: DHA2 family efflux MFS transporter permease subunit [Actinomycetota bacterium]